MSLPWLVGNVDDFRERPVPMSRFETMLLVGVVVCAGAVIGILFVFTWVVKTVVSIASDPNAGPYRQVR